MDVYAFYVWCFVQCAPCVASCMPVGITLSLPMGRFLFTCVDARNTGARRLYEREGFQVVAREQVDEKSQEEIPAAPGGGDEKVNRKRKPDEAAKGSPEQKSDMISMTGGGGGGVGWGWLSERRRRGIAEQQARCNTDSQQRLFYVKECA